MAKKTSGSLDLVLVSNGIISALHRWKTSSSRSLSCSRQMLQNKAVWCIECCVLLSSNTVWGPEIFQPSLKRLALGADDGPSSTLTGETRLMLSCPINTVTWRLSRVGILTCLRWSYFLAMSPGVPSALENWCFPQHRSVWDCSVRRLPNLKFLLTLCNKFLCLFRWLLPRQVVDVFLSKGVVHRLSSREVLSNCFLCRWRRTSRLCSPCYVK